MKARPARAATPSRCERWAKSFSFVFDAVEGEDTLLGTDTVAVREGEVCYRKLTDAVLQRAENGSLSIEARFWEGDSYAPGSGEACSATEGEAPTMEEACIELSTLSAMRVAEIDD